MIYDRAMDVRSLFAFPGFGAAELIGVAQVLIGFIALIVAPEIVRAAFERFRSRLAIDCSPVRRESRKGLFVWTVQIANKSRHFRDISLSIFPEKQGANIAWVRIRTPEDGGLSYSHSISGGCLEMKFARFYRNRTAHLIIAFKDKTIPAFHSEPTRSSRKMPNRDEVMLSHGMKEELIYDRLMMVLLLMISVGCWIFAMIIYRAMTTQMIP